MYANIPSSPACGQWETLLADALDGLLSPDEMALFEAHRASCAPCAALYEQAHRGTEWLEFLGPEPEVPDGLMERLLATTGPGQSAMAPALAGGMTLPPPPAWQRPGLLGMLHRFAEPRLMMTAAMAFFSIALTLNITGIRFDTVKAALAHPSQIRSFMERRLTTASTPVIRYYDHLRVVYEVQSRMREMRGDDNSNSTKQKSDEKKPAPGESHHAAPAHPGQSAQPQLQSARPLSSPEFLQTSVTYRERPVVSLGSPMARRERSTLWTASIIPA